MQADVQAEVQPGEHEKVYGLGCRISAIRLQEETPVHNYAVVQAAVQAPVQADVQAEVQPEEHEKV